ncbi:MAG: hypothetical protein VB050_06380 [Geobacteraceae bacterium]|nr:hypothetical protein [Geobacteraceae bacterium]
MGKVNDMNQVHKLKNLPEFFLCMVAAAILFFAGPASAVEQARQGEDILLATYQRNMGRLERNSFGLPLFVESFERDDRAQVDVYGVFEYPFNSVVNVLKVPANWCDIVSLSPNVKACTYRKLRDDWLLTFYIGRKVYQPPEDTRQIMCHYRNVEQRQGYLEINLGADAGPFGTKNHRMRFEALPLAGGKTFVHVSYACSESVALRLAEKAYFATFGRHKVGFTVTGKDRNGKPVYIGGRRGAIERNTVRYYFAIKTFMNTLSYPAESRFSMRISEWYDLTSRYGKLHFDLSKQEYLANKRRDFNNQIMLQNKAGK